MHTFNGDNLVPGARITKIVMAANYQDIHCLKHQKLDKAVPRKRGFKHWVYCMWKSSCLFTSILILLPHTLFCHCISSKAILRNLLSGCSGLSNLWGDTIWPYKLSSNSVQLHSNQMQKTYLTSSSKCLENLYQFKVFTEQISYFYFLLINNKR